MGKSTFYNELIDTLFAIIPHWLNTNPAPYWCNYFHFLVVHGRYGGSEYIVGMFVSVRVHALVPDADLVRTLDRTASTPAEP